MEQETQKKQQERILRVREMECRFDAVQTAMAQGNDAALLEPDVIGMLQTLTQYYESGQWLEDYERDEQGEFPAELKRGVLSQDALYALLCEIGEIQKSSRGGIGHVQRYAENQAATYRGRMY
jgi:hypothetical protein